MLSEATAPSLADIQEIARRTLQSIGRRNQLLDIFQNRRQALFELVGIFRPLVRSVDPSELSEDQFATIGTVLTRVIDSLEKHLAMNVRRDDVAQCMFLGDSIRDLREAKRWIAQGYSPDPAKRPTEDERRRNAEAHAAQTLASLFS